MSKEREQITAWVTKYALTIGIEKREGEVCHDINSRMLTCDTWGPSFHGDDWHRTPEQALARAEEMRRKKIASLKKQIERLEKMTFSAPV